MSIILYRAINWFARLLILALCARALLSWFGQDPYSGLGKAYRLFVKITEPMVSPCRRLLDRFGLNRGMLDLSVLIAFFLVQIIARILSYAVLIIF